MPIGILVTAGTTADCKQAVALIDGFTAEYLLADRGYDTNEILEKALQTNMKVVIPPKKIGKNSVSMISIC